MSDQGDVAILGAGPYGLSLAAHLRARAFPSGISGCQWSSGNRRCRTACS